MSYIEEALEKARALAKQAKDSSAPGRILKDESPTIGPVKPNSGGLAAVAAAKSLGISASEYRGAGTVACQEDRTLSRPGPGINPNAPHMIAQSEGRRLFMGGLSYETTDESLEAYLSSRWPTEECKVKRDQEGSSRGFAFVSFPTQPILESCFEAQPHYIDGKKVELRKVSADGTGSWGGSSEPAEKRPSMGMTRYGGGGPNTTRIYIGSGPSDTSRYRGLDDSINDDDMKNYFERYGNVTGIAQHRWEDTGRKKGFGYIEFGEFESAQAALGIHWICGKELEVKPYSSGGVRTPTAAPGGPVRHPPSAHSYSSGTPHSSGYGYGGNTNHAGYGASDSGGGGYGNDAKRQRTGDAAPSNPGDMMNQMKTMMSQMQNMQQQMQYMSGGSSGGGGGGNMQQQMSTMQQSMYGMMQNQYWGAGQNGGAHGSSGGGGGGWGSGGAQPYNYPANIEYPQPKPPGAE